jgi:hypothetical protein
MRPVPPIRCRCSGNSEAGRPWTHRWPTAAGRSPPRRPQVHQVSLTAFGDAGDAGFVEREAAKAQRIARRKAGASAAQWRGIAMLDARQLSVVGTCRQPFVNAALRAHSEGDGLGRAIAAHSRRSGRSGCRCRPRSAPSRRNACRRRRRTVGVRPSGAQTSLSGGGSDRRSDAGSQPPWTTAAITCIDGRRTTWRQPRGCGPPWRRGNPLRRAR